jgi:histidyl-tRNA synthetase
VAFTLIIGESEAEAGQVTVRDMAKGEQYPVALEDVITWLNQRLG